MKTNRLYSLIAILALLLAACQDKDYDIQPMAVESIDASQITGTLSGDNYIWTWPQLEQGRKMLVSLYTMGLSLLLTLSVETLTPTATSIPMCHILMSLRSARVQICPRVS